MLPLNFSVNHRMRSKLLTDMNNWTLIRWYLAGWLAGWGPLETSAKDILAGFIFLLFSFPLHFFLPFPSKIRKIINGFFQHQLEFFFSFPDFGFYTHILKFLHPFLILSFGNHSTAVSSNLLFIIIGKITYYLLDLQRIEKFFIKNIN